MALLVGPAHGLGVPGVQVNDLPAAGLLARLHLGKAVDGKALGHAADTDGDGVLLQAGNGPVVGGQGPAHPHGVDRPAAVQVHPDVLPHLQGGDGGQHVVFIDVHVDGQGDGAVPAAEAGKGQLRGAVPVGGHGGNHPALPGEVGVLGQLGKDAPLVHEADGPPEHGGHFRPGQGALGHEVIGLVPLHDAVHVQQVHVGLKGGGDGVGVHKAHIVAGQAVGQGGQLHSPH